MVTSSEVRRRFLGFFEARGHRVLSSAPLVPRGDPTSLFILAGMQPFKAAFLGLEEPAAPTVATIQKVFRTVDIDEVGDTYHQTFFEMLGNFSFGDYFKQEAIEYAWELLTGPFELKADRLRVTVHETDDVAEDLWRSQVGVPAARITRFGDEHNWWAAGATGPCGPDSEIFFDLGAELGCGQADCGPQCPRCARWLEIWNLVFVQYDRQPSGELVRLPRPCIDTGSGLERVTTALGGFRSSFDCDLLRPLVDHFAEATSTSYGADLRQDRSLRVLTDHSRAVCFLVGDGVSPTNEGRGYVLRRLIRRALLHGRRLGMRGRISAALPVLREIMAGFHPELEHRAAIITATLDSEQERFERTLESGVEHFETAAAHGAISGADAFRLHDTFGFPLELTLELAEERAITVDQEGFRQELEQQRQRSRSRARFQVSVRQGLPEAEFLGYDTLSAEGTVQALYVGDQRVEAAHEGDEVEVYLERTPFYAEAGGQRGDQGMIVAGEGLVDVTDTQRPQGGRAVAHVGVVRTGTVRVGDAARADVDREVRAGVARHHSATHLLHRALHEVLGAGATQAGSYVGERHTTFDFHHPAALTAEQLDRVMRMVNRSIRDNLARDVVVMGFDEATASGAMALFGEKYGDQVRVVSFGDYSRELCGGTHVNASGEIGLALAISESSVAAGVRRLHLLVGAAAEEEVARREQILARSARSLGVPPAELPARVDLLREELRQRDRELEKLRAALRSASQGDGGAVEDVAGVPAVFRSLPPDQPVEELRRWADSYFDRLGQPGVVVVVSSPNLVVKVAQPLVDAGVDAGRLCREAAGAGGGRGGGRPGLAQGGGITPGSEEMVLARGREVLALARGGG
ncbi:MAG: alanine--tRNA ligase [Candidatus Dormibacteria bacterium]